MKASTVRAWYRTHKWSSLLCTAFLLMACLTGLPLVFSEQLESILEPHVAPADIAGPSTANLDAMVSIAQTHFPSLHPFSIYWDDDEPRVFVTMSPSDKPKDGEIRQAVFDAHTGHLLEIPHNGFHLLNFILEMHRALFLGLTGELVMGLMALSFIVSLATGFLIYGPFMRHLHFGTYRIMANKRTRWFDLHNLVGIVTFTWAIVVGATGFINAISTPLFGFWRAQIMPSILAPYKGMPSPTHVHAIDTVVTTVEQSMPTMRVNSVLFPNAVFGSPQHFLVWTSGKTSLTSRLMTPVLIDAQSGQITQSKSLPWYLRLLEISRPLHFGDYAGTPLRLLWGLFDLALIIVLFSGMYLWVVRRKAPLEQELNRLVQKEQLTTGDNIQ